MIRIHSFKLQLAIAIITMTTLFMAILGFIGVETIAGLIRDQVESSAQAVVDLKAVEIRSFFVERGRTVSAMLASPDLREWFESYNEFRRPLDNDHQYDRVIGLFQAVEDGDSSVMSCFFATNSTSEYFKADGRVERDNYFVKERWWWKEAVEQDRLYISPPGIDANTNDIAVTIQTTVKNADQSLLGVGGVDFKIDTVGALIDRVRFRDQGQAFLTDKKGQLIYFPGLDARGEMNVAKPLETKLREIDKMFEDSSGFARLAEEIESGMSGIGRVRLNGSDRIVVYSPVRSELPEFHWSLALMLPEQLVSKPTARARLITAGTILLALAAIAFTAMVVTDRVVARPVAMVVSRFRDIAQGEGDLTQRIDTSSSNEISELATSFNNFVSTIQSDISSVAALAETLSSSADDLSSLSNRMADGTESTSNNAQVVSDSAEQVSDNVGMVASATTELTASIREISSNAAQAATVAEQAVDLAEATSARFEELRQGAEGISAFAGVIDSIAAQTNLLALNATIEAARAGVAGKGFAVVAAEVKELAGQTSQATEEIRSRIELIEGSTERAGEGIKQVREIIRRINDIQGVIAVAVEQQTTTCGEINHSVSAAAEGSGNIAHNISDFAGSLGDSAASADDVRNAAEALATLSSKLERIIGRFIH